MFLLSSTASTTTRGVFLFFSFSFMATLSMASRLQVSNFCPTSLWIVANTPTTPTSSPQELRSGEALQLEIINEGNSFGAAKQADYYSDATPKLVLGASVDAETLYWSVAAMNGDPFMGEHWNVTGCDATTTYGPRVYTCADGDFALELNTCFE